MDGRPAPRPRIAKSYELLAYLLSRTKPEASRGELLTALFDGRSDDSARSYLRQAIHQLRESLPDEVGLVSDSAGVRLADEPPRVERVRAPGDPARRGGPPPGRGAARGPPRGRSRSPSAGSTCPA